MRPAWVDLCGNSLASIGQGVHVGAQADGAAARALAQHADQAGAGDAAMDFDAPFGQQCGDLFGGAVLLEAEFGMGVQVAADVDEAGDVGKGVDDVHGFKSGVGFKPFSSA